MTLENAKGALDDIDAAQNYMAAYPLVMSAGPVAQSRRSTPTGRSMDSAADRRVRLAEPPKRTAESAVECTQTARKSPGFKSPRARHLLLSYSDGIRLTRLMISSRVRVSSVRFFMSLSLKRPDSIS